MRISVKSHSNASITSKDDHPSNLQKEIIKDLNSLSYFRENILPNRPEIKKVIGSENIRRVLEIGDIWLVETYDPSHQSGYEIKPENIRSIIEPRFFYILTDSYITRVNNRPFSCFIERAKVISHQKDIPINSSLAEDMLLITGPCNMGEYFISLHKFSSGERIPFTVQAKLISKYTPHNSPLASNIIDEEGFSHGFLVDAIFGKEPVIVVDLKRHDQQNPPTGFDSSPSQGIAIFSISSGKLLNLLLYNSF